MGVTNSTVGLHAAHTVDCTPLPGPVGTPSSLNPRISLVVDTNRTLFASGLHLAVEAAVHVCPLLPHVYTPHYTMQQCQGARTQGPQCPQDSVARAAEEQFDALAKRFPTLHAAASTSASPRRLAAQHGTPPSVSRALTRASEDAWTSQFEDISSAR